MPHIGFSTPQRLLTNNLPVKMTGKTNVNANNRKKHNAEKRLPFRVEVIPSGSSYSHWHRNECLAPGLDNCGRWMQLLNIFDTPATSGQNPPRPCIRAKNISALSTGGIGSNPAT